ncbi:MAG: glycosyltransferase family 2 protein [Cetobacterium sp.]|uniref:glycosyltransferase family 2 protein n=1 Tax=Cetobacterium sp. TaxID=2071632 RepID=UPI003F3BC420
MSYSKYTEPKVSIVVPVYNAEKYIKRCIDSILCQTLEEIEVILVNDGSTDKSGKICDEYSLKDNRVKVIHKKNNRVAAARNDGLRIAKGEYIGFVDSDDWIENNMYFDMYDKAIEYECDLIMCDYTKKGKQIEYTVSQPIREGYYIKKEIEDNLFKSLIMFENIEFPVTISNWSCLLKKEIIIKNNLFYDEDIHYCEDSIFGSKLMYHSKSFYYMKNKFYYNYFYNQSSTTNSYNEKKWDSYLKINEKLELYFKNSGFDFSRQIKINMLYFTLNMLSEVGKSNENFFSKYIYCKKIINNSRVKRIFKDFKIPKVCFGLRIVSNFIKYRLGLIYSLIFYLKGKK